jgi:low temperature requirement protein LtrA
LSAIFAFGFTVSVIIWTISLFLSGPIKYVVWGLGLFIDILTPLFTLDTQSKLPKISISHIPERFGLLIILTIGETVVSSVNVLAANGEFTLSAVISGVLGLFISFLIWWLYIDHVMYRVFKRNVWHILSWSYLHLPLTISITAVGSGILAISNLSSHNHSSPSIHWLLCGSVASVLIFTALLGLVSENKDHHFGVIDFHKKNNRSLFLYKIISAVLALIAGMLGSFTNSLMLLVILVIILAISPIQGLTLWIKSHLELSKRNEKITQTIK